MATFRAALEERKRERAPAQWAATQISLGHALRSLGARQTGTERLTEAVAAYRAGLEERTRANSPLQWAAAESDLAGALGALGARESGTGHLDEAAAAYGAALQEFTRERAPLQWAVNTGNQGIATMLSADRKGDAAMAEAALAKIQAAEDAMQAGGQSRNAEFFAAQRLKAQAIADRLSGR